MSTPKFHLFPGLSGYVPVRNGFKLDYAWQLAVESLLPFCDEVIISVGLTREEEDEGDDGTLEFAREWAHRDPKVKVILDKWVDAVNDKTMLRRWLNRCRVQCTYDHQITLDADEVLDPCFGRILKRATSLKRPLWASRINLWRDPFHEAPHNTVCGQRVVRFGPTMLEMVSDGPESPEASIRVQAIDEPEFVIWHLGFLRKPDAFYAKSKVMQRHLHNCYDPRLTEAENTGKPWVDLCPFIDGNNGQKIPLIEHGLTIPDIIKPWLTERGYKV